MPEIKVEAGDVKIIDFIAENEMASSKSEARRLLEQGAVKLDQEKVSDESIKFEGEHVLQVGKRRFLKIIVK